MNRDYDPYFYKKYFNDFDIMNDSCEITSSCKVVKKTNRLDILEEI